jgi:hypothetical protein
MLVSTSRDALELKDLTSLLPTTLESILTFSFSRSALIFAVCAQSSFTMPSAPLCDIGPRALSEELSLMPFCCAAKRWLPSAREAK